MRRTIYASKDAITLLYSEIVDRELVYNMAFEEDAIWQSMFNCREQFDWSEIRDEESHFFGSEPGLSKYLLIEYNGQIIGTISHTYNDGKIVNMELDMWMRSVKYTGRSIGTKVIQLLVERLVEDYKIKTFIVRPWIKNPRAIRAYEKAGFVVADAFAPEDYYGKYFAEWGQGNYPEGENYNMVLSIS